ncbi:MAG: hypothetical protein CME62_00790 [Halobacteriovoraceae bacterium]|nr:hypothetical protein [Halobacteriovoraceae bacterium]|tara:strand:- start:1758 stop:2213 length:456 start_codon:yes stop_codon:yes gene_type:complete
MEQQHEILEKHTDISPNQHSTFKSEWKESAQELLDDLTLLVEKQKKLVRAEVSEKSDDLKNGFESIGLGAALLIMFLQAFTALIVIALNNFMALWAAVSITTVVLGALGYTVLRYGTSKLSLKKLLPKKSIHTMNLMSSRIKESYHALRHS